MRDPHRTATVLILAASGLLLAGCGDDGVVDETPDLAGSYELVSITFQGQQPLGPPAATGTLDLTQTTYEVNIDIQGQQPIVDNGTYSVSGDEWTQESSVSGVQSVGTFTFDGTTLTVSVTTQNQQIENVWRKTG